MMPNSRRGQPDEREQRATRVERGGLVVARAGAVDGDGDGGEGDDGDVDEERRAPPELLEQRAGHDRAERSAGAGEADPDGDRPLPLLGREDGGDQRQRRRHHERRAGALHGPARR